MKQNDSNIIPFGNREHRKNIRELGKLVAQLDYSDEIPCRVHTNGRGGLLVYTADNKLWLGGYHSIHLFDMSAVSGIASRLFVKDPVRFVEPLVRLAG